MKLDAVVVRHQVSGVPHFLAKKLPVNVHIINAGELEDHPALVRPMVSHFQISAASVFAQRAQVRALGKFFREVRVQVSCYFAVASLRLGHARDGYEIFRHGLSGVVRLITRVFA